MIHEGEYGFRLVLKTGYDFSGFNSLSMNFRKPDGSRVSKGASTTDASAGDMYYTVEDGFFDDAGKYRVQGEIAFAGKTLKTERVTLKIRSAV